MHSGTGRQIVAFWLLASLFMAGHGCSRDGATLGVDQARELYALSHIPPQFDFAQEFLIAQIALRQATWSPEQSAAASRVAEERLASGSLSSQIIARLAATAEPPFTKEILEWLRTPEVRQVHAAAGATTNTETAAEFRKFMTAMDRPKPSAERLALVERYNQAARSSSDSLASLRLAIYGAGVMSDAIEPPDARVGADALKEFSEQKTELLEPIFQELSAVTLVFAFRGWSDADVAAFVERCESEPLQWYYVTLSTVFFDILEEISNDLGSAFVAALESQPDA
jgi:hypothetical protein